MLVNGYVCLSQLRWAQEDRKGSVEAIKLASELSQASPGSLWGPLVAMEWRWLGFKLKEAPDLAILIDQPENDVDLEQPQPNYVRLIDG